MRYTPSGSIPTEPDMLTVYLAQELDLISSAIESVILGGIELTGAMPPRPRTGNLAIADGSSWDPGAGFGLYYYDGSNWKHIADADGIVESVDSLADLKLIDGESEVDNKLTVLMRWGAAEGDGEGGPFYWKTGDATAGDDWDTVESASSGAGRWKRIFHVLVREHTALTHSSGEKTVGVFKNTSALTGDDVYDAVYPSVAHFDTLQSTTHIATSSTVEGGISVTGYVKNDSANCNGVGLFGCAIGTANGVANWGLNTLLQDNATRATNTLTGQIMIGAELDFNCMCTDTQIIGCSVGGNSLAQSTNCIGYIVNVLGSGIKWNTGLYSQDQATDDAIVIGRKNASAANVPSQNIKFVTDDSGGTGQIGTLYAKTGNTFEFTGLPILQVNSANAAMQVIGTSPSMSINSQTSGNGHQWFLDNSAAVATVFWDRSNDRLTLRKYDTDHATVRAQIELYETSQIDFSTDSTSRLLITNNYTKIEDTLGIGTTPEAWTLPVLRFGGVGASYASATTTVHGHNFYYDGTLRYTTTAAASYYSQNGGNHVFASVASGTAGTATGTFTTLLTLNTTALTATRQVIFPTYTIAGGLPSGSAGATIYVSDETGGAVLCFHDGTNWRRVTDRAIAA